MCHELARIRSLEPPSQTSSAGSETRNPRTRALRQKADQDPATWQPPYEPARCRYAAEWTAIKTRWKLSIDTAEQQALNALATACPTQHLPTLAEDQR